MKKGKVFLVGAGPGDWELITVKGLKHLKQADVVVYDHLASPRLLRHVRPETELIYVGKKAGDHTLNQDKINVLLADKADEGKNVVRLKGGDPFIFGRGGEEALVLKERGVEFEIVPGITAGAAVPAYAGIPVTHRGITSTMQFITGHEAVKEGSDIDWSRISPGPGTLIFFMGVKNLNLIAQNLVQNGRSPECPAALVRWGTTSNQRTVTASLKDIAETAEKAGMEPPALFIVGGVVGLREKLNWFETKPLFGKKIVVTRSRSQASKLVETLEELGAEAIELPTIKIEFPEGPDELDVAIDNIKQYDWIAFTSANGVEAFFNRFMARTGDVRALGDVKIASIGIATSKKINRYNLPVAFQPTEFVAECFAKEFLEQHNASGKKILLVRSDKARAYLADKLSEAGADIDSVVGYNTLPPGEENDEVLARISNGEADWVTFSSSSTAENFFDMYNGEKTFKIASIGPITSGAIRQCGHEVDIEAEEYTIAGVVDAILKYHKDKN